MYTSVHEPSVSNNKTPCYNHNGAKTKLEFTSREEEAQIKLFAFMDQIAQEKSLTSCISS